MQDDNKEVNVLEMLIGISERLARVEENTKGLHGTDNTAVKALNIATQNRQDIQHINSQSTWAFRTAITAIVAPIIVALMLKFM